MGSLMFAVFGGPMVYQWSAARTAAEVNAASYTPPPKKKSINDIILERQLAKYHEERKAANQSPPTQDAPDNEANTVAEAEDEDLEDHERVIKAAHTELLAAEQRALPTTATGGVDPFGNPLNADGTMVGGDPCQGHHRPEDGFKGPEWLQICVDNDVVNADGVPDPWECERFLEYSWSTGDGSIVASFELPPGCID